MSHAIHSPSSAKRWTICPAAPSREALQPDTTNPSAEWGTAAHARLEQALLSNTPPVITAQSEDAEAREQAACAQVAFDYAKERETADAPCAIRAEEKVYPGAWLGLTDDLYGTADITLVSQTMLEVVDLKTGYTFVPADDPQLKLYLLGAVLPYQNPQDGSFPFTTLRATIVQPRHEGAEPIRSVDYTINDLYDWLMNVVRPAYEASLQPNPPAVPSPDGCKWCRAAKTCRELAETSMQAVTQIRQPVSDNIHIPDIGTLSQQQLRQVLDAAPLLEGWLKTVRDHVYDILDSGGTFPGYKLVAGRGSRAWNISEAEVEKKLKAFKLKIDDYKPRSLISPAQAEKALHGTKYVAKSKNGDDKGKSPLDAIIESRPGSPKLVPDTNPAPALTGGNKFGITDLEPKTEQPQASIACLM